MRAPTQLRIAISRLKTDAHTRKSYDRYNHDYDREVQEISFVKPIDFIFHDNLPLQPATECNTKAM